eukprot:CAMPEP_0168555298 /NCGR_PEP_ID=MMETSP0413-20121227/8254_1 /TAXON_ID=136452 /ORGANISM="Filamoeba nolandi, Strain NC-AS-23-1" /LENGTH=386 /DNA_ID=CAMNT_0008586127 /DNA_START=411 /DNA_END=1570 /DNA_ORIENTATION=+
MEIRRGHSRQSSLSKPEDIDGCGDLPKEDAPIPIRAQIKQLLKNKNKKKLPKARKPEAPPMAGEGSPATSEVALHPIQEITIKKKLLKKQLHAFHLRSHLRFSTAKILKFRQVCESGLSSEIRGMAWQVLMGSTCEQFSLRQENPQLYKNLLESPHHQSQTLIQIEKDLVRLFACTPLFAEVEIQESLRNVLKAVALFYPEVGYCQGMDHIAGFLVLQMSEEDAFWGMLRLLDSYGFAEIWRPGLPAMPKCFFITERLLEKHLPRIYNHMKQNGIDISMFATSWFITIFLYNHTFDLSVRLWDSFLFEGFYFMYVVVLALFSIHEEEILKMDFEETLKFLQFNSRQENVVIDPDTLIAACNMFKNPLISDLQSLEKEYATTTSGSH